MPLLATAGVAPSVNGDLLDFSNPGNLASMKAKKAIATVQPENGSNCIKLEFSAAKGYPGVRLPAPANEEWDLTGCTSVESEVTNRGAKAVSLALRVDNPEGATKEPWITGLQVALAPGETKTLSVKLSPSKKASYTLDPAHVCAINIFAVKPGDASSVLIKNVKAVR